MRQPLKTLLGAFGFAVVLALCVAPESAVAQRIAPKDVTRPAGTKPFAGDSAKLLAAGKARHGDTKLSPHKRSCNTCHLKEDTYNATFKKPWPHFVESVKDKTGLDTITAEGMVQFCMISAMGTRPLPWDSETLAALTAFVLARHAKVVENKASAMSDRTLKASVAPAAKDLICGVEDGSPASN